MEARAGIGEEFPTALAVVDGTSRNEAALITFFTSHARSPDPE
jgi:hypothetical protein